MQALSLTRQPCFWGTDADGLGDPLAYNKVSMMNYLGIN